MNNITLNWFICKVRFVRMLDNGQKKRVTESYVVAASSFAEAESRIVEEMQAYYANGGLEVVEIDRAGFNEIVFMDRAQKVFDNDAKKLSDALNKKDKEAYKEWNNQSLEDRMQNTETLWYKSKVQFADIDVDAGKEKRVNIYYLVEGASLESARRRLDNFLSGSSLDYSIVSVSETSIIDVIVPAAG